MAIISPTAEQAQSDHLDESIEAQLAQWQVIKRDGTVTQYNADRITTALKKAFLAVEGAQAKQSERIEQITQALTRKITSTLKSRWPVNHHVPIETIQDFVELELMRAEYQTVAHAYVVYREKRHQHRLKQQASQCKTIPSIHITLDDGKRIPLDQNWLMTLATQACEGLTDVLPDEIVTATIKNLFDGVKLSEVYKSIIISVRPLIETEPNYSYVAARLLLASLTNETTDALNIAYDPMQQTTDQIYQAAFKAYIQWGLSAEILTSDLTDFDLDYLAKAILPERDQQFNYLGLQTLYDRYFVKKDNLCIELPQVFFMRVAMGLAHCEGQARNERAIEFYQLLSSFDYMSSTPTLFNSGTTHQQLSSCYLSTVQDDLYDIYSALRDNAMLSKFAGGLGNDWTNVRASGAKIKGTRGKSLGIVPFLNVADASILAVNQGGKRKGAGCAYLELFHRDIEAFLELRKNTGDDRLRTHDMNTANWIPDLFMKRVHEKADWTLFSPNDVPELHDSFGDSFEEKYIAYEKKAKANEIDSKTIPAVTLWRKMLSMLFETGHPWFTFKDPCNIRSPQQHVGVVHSSNLCTEITLNTSKDEIAVCNLGSVNLANHMHEGKLDQEKIARTVKTAIRMLDNVIDINYYPVPQARTSNLRHRPIGLGIMGFQDALYQQNIAYQSQAAVEFADRSMELISYHAILASANLAKERGQYESYAGSLWDQGTLPIDSLKLLKNQRSVDHFKQDMNSSLDWHEVRQIVKSQGMRNSNVMAIAPTATIANICGVSQSIEPTYQNLFVKSNLSGEFTIVNPYLVKALKAEKIWDNVMVNDLKYYNGSIAAIKRIPERIRTLFATAFEIEPKWLIESASRRQKWIDQSQSLNLYLANPSGKALDQIYRMAWVFGLKTTYYLRTMAATGTEKATITDDSLSAVKANQPKACSIDDPDCEACQ